MPPPVALTYNTSKKITPSHPRIPPPLLIFLLETRANDLLPGLYCPFSAVLLPPKFPFPPSSHLLAKLCLLIHIKTLLQELLPHQESFPTLLQQTRRVEFTHGHPHNVRSRKVHMLAEEDSREDAPQCQTVRHSRRRRRVRKQVN